MKEVVKPASLKVRHWREKNREKDREQSRARYLKNREHYLARNAQYHRENREKRSAAHRLRRLGVTAERFNSMYAEQEGKCGICFKSLERYGKNTAVDHDHVTGKIRKILCLKCNTGIALFGDNTTVLKSAIAYLEAQRG